jgi:hypothetical protein
VQERGEDCLRFGRDPAVIACDGRTAFPYPMTAWTIDVRPGEAP